MAKAINVAFLESVCPEAMPDRSYGAMLTWLFGEDERSVAICGGIAFESMKRRFRKILKLSAKHKQIYQEDVSALVVRSIDNLLLCGLEPDSFDAWHKSTCDKICEMSGRYIENGFTYGMAQYLLNMTIKHMLLMEQWDEQLEPLKNTLHIPVDYKIMESAFIDFGILVPCKSGGVAKYSLTGSKDDSKPLRDWAYDEYTKFQNDLRKVVACPMYWEFSIWT